MTWSFLRRFYSQKRSFLGLLKTYVDIRNKILSKKDVKKVFRRKMSLWIPFTWFQINSPSANIYFSFTYDISIQNWFFCEYHFPLFQNIFYKLVILNFVLVKNSNFGAFVKTLFWWKLFAKVNPWQVSKSL